MKSKYRILVMEDDDNVRLPLVDLLEANGYEVDAVADGEAGMTRAKENLPDLIVSDIMMPKKDGFEVFDALQDEPKTAVIPFIFLSAKADPTEVREGLGLGADDYITKPFKNDDLLSSIKVRLEKFKRISEAATTLESEEDYDQVFIKDGDSCWFVEYERIRLLESEDNYVRIFFDKEKPLLSRTLNYMEEKLPARMFFRANRKQMINLRWIKNIQPWFNGGMLVILKDDTRVQMSRRASQAFRAKMGI